MDCHFQVMCIQYWPPALDKTEVYGNIHIGIAKEEQLANFQIRTFRIWKEGLDVSIRYHQMTARLQSADDRRKSTKLVDSGPKFNENRNQCNAMHE